jgi:PAS domain S-box-containing protein
MLQTAENSVSETCINIIKDEKLRILHVDDDSEFLAVAKKCLEEQGEFKVDTAISVEKALKKFKSAEYDAVVADYQMPGKNGLELLHELRARGSDVPFILFTCKGKEEIAIEALNAGICQYINKQGNAETTYEELRRSICNAVKRRREEKLLKDSESRLRQITENMQDLLMLTDEKLIIRYASASYKWILGYDPNEMVGKHAYDFVHPDDLPTVMEITKKALEDRVPGKIEARVKRADGGYSLLEGLGKILTDEDGHVTGAVLTSRDTTEQKRMEKALKESEEKYRKLFDEALDAIFVADAQTGILVDCNRAATELTGRAKSELIGMHQRFLHPPEETTGEFSRTFKQHRTDKEGIVVEDQIITKNGEIRDVTIKGNQFEVSGKKMLRGVFRDITESKKISEKARFQARLLNAVGQAVIATDIKGNITYWNRAAEQVYGWPEAEVLGRNIVDITPAETSREQASDIMNRLIAGESWSGEFLARRHDGMIFPAIVTNAPIANEKGEIVGIIGVSTEISEQKWMQEVFNEAIGKVAELNEKLCVVEGLTRHDVRNKLSALNGRIYLLKKRLGCDENALQQLREMELVSQQILRILEFGKLYAQVGAEEMEDVDVEAHVDEAVTLFSDLKGAQLTNDCSGLKVLADSLLRQLFYNLIDNTLKYGEKTTKIRVHYEEEENQLKLIYGDNGVGIPSNVRKHLFKEGYGKGTGYGLYLVKRICDAYGWKIEETGKEGQGAQFIMTILKKRKDNKKGYEIA